jgi:glucosamine 6-phosphate synthetase-like amidotransferase/phosphosugar isomerase protein
LCIGITQIPGSNLEKLADITLVAGGGLSHSPVMTMTYASTLTAAHLLLLEYFEAPQMIFKDLIVSSERCQSGIQATQNLITEIVPQLVQYEHSFHFGGGPAYAAALETALKMKEMACLHAEASETWEMASGAATMVGENVFCVALYTGGKQDDSTASLAQHVLDWGAGLLEIGPEALAGKSHSKSWFIPVALPFHPSFCSLVLVPPAALIAYCLARSRNINPDHPNWRERYISQGMTHLAGEED